MDDDRIIIRDKYGHSKSVHALQPKTAKDLMETEIVKPDEIVKGLLPVGASILAGEPKCGKSFIVMQMGFGGCQRHAILRDGNSKMQGFIL